MNIFKIPFTKKENSNYKELVQQGAIIIDVRTVEEFKDGHIHGAINIPLDILPEKAQGLGKKDAQIITCCASGARSAVAKNILCTAGYDNVHNGGGWRTLQGLL